MDAAENLGVVSRLHLSFKRIVERSHDMVYVIPRQISADPDGYVADILDASREFEQLTHSLPDEINSWTDDKFEEAFKEAQRLDVEASARLEALVSQAENLQKVVRDKLHTTCKLICGAVLHSQGDMNATSDSLCRCGQPFRANAKYCAYCGSLRQDAGIAGRGPSEEEKHANEENHGNLESASLQNDLDDSIEAEDGKSESAKKLLPQPLLRELVADNKRRFSEELEFLLLLADVRYVNYLASQGYFQDEAFLNFLKYLLYWREQPYVQWVIYPQALRMLQMLQDPLFREKVKLVDVCDWLVRQNFYRSSVPEDAISRKGLNVVESDRQPMLSYASSSLSNTLAGKRSLPEAFNKFVEPKLSNWSDHQSMLKKRCAPQILECWERILRQKYRQSQKDQHIVDHFELPAKMDKVRARLTEYGTPAPDVSWQRFCKPIVDSKNYDLSQVTTLCAELTGKSCVPGRQIIADESISVVSAGRSILSTMSKHSKGSASSGCSKDVSMDGPISVVDSGDGASSSLRVSSANDPEKVQAKRNAVNPVFHGEWLITIPKKNGSCDSEHIWGKAYVSSDMSYLAPRKKSENIPFVISGEGTDASPFVLKARRRDPATLVDRGPHSLLWRLANGSTTYWKRPS